MTVPDLVKNEEDIVFMRFMGPSGNLGIGISALALASAFKYKHCHTIEIAIRAKN